MDIVEVVAAEVLSSVGFEEVTSVSKVGVVKVEGIDEMSPV